MIKIINNGLACKSCSNDKYKYSIIINDEIITTFIHERSKGLSECLFKAALAVKEKENKDRLKSNEDIFKTIEEWRNESFRKLVKQFKK